MVTIYTVRFDTVLWTVYWYDQYLSYS